MTNNNFIAVSNICQPRTLNVLSKPENGKVFRNARIFYSIEFHLVIIVTDMKCNVADNVVLANMHVREEENKLTVLC